MNKELKVVNLLHKWMLMALVLTMLPKRTPSTLVITEVMAITMDDLVVHEVEEDDEISPRTNRSISGATHHITADSSNLASKNDYKGKEKLVIGKLHQESFPSVAVKTNKPFQLIHSDVWGLSSNISIEGPPSVFFLVIAMLIKGIDVLVLLVGLILLSSASLPSYPATGTTVPIIDNMTMSKSGIYKPKVYSTVVALPNHFQEPSSVRQALQLPHWKTEMEAKYSAFVHNARSALVSWEFQSSIFYNSLFHSRKNGHLVLALISRFALKTLSSISYFLGFEAFIDSSGLYLNQAKYIFDLLIKTNMVHAKPSSTPMVLGQKLALEDSAHFPDVTLYRSTIGALQYLTLTRPDISFSVNKLSQFL
ncbi:Retrovirus-related Pol polyprotein from transposon RE2 [Vitis vinifera]|uniref:Retrovirus-related Pol polyprotein from transposon RE2 n=1 Tax=Vitis vinifera TaxID=29760 RepID=A0A438FBG5_VITVI|nr:Retrovirus-related Pol polyprotein from transposon RE2 [Vitis vinifera]